MAKDKPYYMYLGDGVYASFDGYHILLHVGSHDSTAVVALEPDVMKHLNEYNEMITELRSTKGLNDAQVRGT